MKVVRLIPFLLLTGCVTVGPGQIGVLWTINGGTSPIPFAEGSHYVNSWDQLYIYDLRAMSNDELLNVIASNGLGIELDASVRYHLDPSEVVALHKEIGPGYYKKIIEPVLRSEARRVIGRFTPEEIYSTKRDIIERDIREGLISKIEGKHIALEAVLIRNVALPDAIRNAIDQKLSAEQDVLKMKYVLEVTKARAEERRIEAGGVADYNRVIADSLTPAVLEFQRTQQLGQLATSPNSKTVVVGPGTNPQLLLSAPPAGETRPRTVEKPLRAPGNDQGQPSGMSAPQNQ
jgi:regulator of protease activity HflC (stomatin/prohibitin superfamily)